jgi:hypothetical protein
MFLVDVSVRRIKNISRRGVWRSQFAPRSSLTFCLNCDNMGLSNGWTDGFAELELMDRGATHCDTFECWSGHDDPARTQGRTRCRHHCVCV